MKENLFKRIKRAVIYIIYGDRTIFDFELKTHFKTRYSNYWHKLVIKRNSVEIDGQTLLRKH